MGEIRIVGLGKTRGYPYPVCKKSSFAADGHEPTPLMCKKSKKYNRLPKMIKLVNLYKIIALNNEYINK